MDIFRRGIHRQSSFKTFQLAEAMATASPPSVEEGSLRQTNFPPMLQLYFVFLHKNTKNATQHIHEDAQRPLTLERGPYHRVVA